MEEGVPPVVASPTTRPRARPVQVVFAAGLALLTVGLVPSISSAEPAPSITEVQQRIQDLQTQGEIADQDVLTATAHRDELATRSAAAKAEVAARQADLNASLTQLGEVASAAYKNSNQASGLTLMLSSSNVQDYAARTADLQHLQQSRADEITAVRAAKVRLTEAATEADRDLAAQQAVEVTLSQREQVIRSSIATEQSLLASLTAQQKAELAAAQAAAEQAALEQSRAVAAAAAAADAARASRATRSQAAPAGPTSAPPGTASAGTASPGPTYSGPATGQAGAAVQMAYAQLGKPYQYGATGPGSFDCSGLTSFVWRAAGVSLPRVAADQYNSGRKVAQSDVQPGDLVYFGSPIHHVGIYIGNGQMIDAPHTGDVVRIQGAFRSDYVGATRP